MPQLSASASEASAGHSRPGLFACALGSGLLLVAAMAIPCAFGLLYTGDDLGAFHLPVRQFYAEQLGRGEPFHWMPQLYGGFYLAGEGQAGVYHPLHWVIYRCLPLGVGWTIELVASYPFMLAGAYFFLRRRVGRRDAAMFGSLVFTFCGFNLLHFVHPNAVATIAHVPWLLWAIDVFTRSSSQRKTATALTAIAILTASQILLGHPQSLWFSLLAEAAYVLLNFATDQRPLQTGRILRTYWLLGVAKMAGLLIGAVQWLPTLDALEQSSRSTAHAAFANLGSLHPLNLIQLVAPYLLENRVVGQSTHELGIYCGAVPLALLAWLVVARRRLGPWRPTVVLATAVGLVSLLLAFGQFGPLYRFQRLLPIVGGFRMPCRYVALVQLSVAVLSSVSLALLLRNGEQQKEVTRGELKPLGLLWAASAITALVGLVNVSSPVISATPAVLAGPALVGTAVLLVALSARGIRWAPVVLILFAAADLGYYGLSHSAYNRMETYDGLVGRAETPPAPAPGRLLADLLRFDESAVRTGNQMILAGWSRADGYAGLAPVDVLDYGQISTLRVAGVGWVMRNERTSRIRGTVPYDSRWLTVPDPLPPVRLVTRAQTSGDPACDIRKIDVRSTALVDDPMVLSGGSPGVVARVDRRADRFCIQARCATTQLLVVSERFHPGWQAWINGRPSPVRRTNGDFLGCVISPGEHEIVLEFRPQSLRRGFLMSCLGLVLLPIVVAFHLRRGRAGTGCPEAETDLDPSSDACPAPTRRDPPAGDEDLGDAKEPESRASERLA